MIRMAPRRTISRVQGFTLTELAIVLVIVALLLGGMFVSFGTQRDVANIKTTEKRLADIRDALLGFVAVHGRLPCPASPGAATGTEAVLSGGVCINKWDGFVPAVTLGIYPTDAQGYAIDAWGNRIRYAVTDVHTNAYTDVNGIFKFWKSTTTPDLHVCSTAAGKTANDCATANVRLSENAVAVLISSGRNGALSPSSADEVSNISNDKVFVSRTPSQAGSAEGEFDDIVIWISPYILYSRMIAAGQLP